MFVCARSCIVKCIHRSFMFKFIFKNSKNVSASSDRHHQLNSTEHKRMMASDDAERVNLNMEAFVYTFYYIDTYIYIAFLLIFFESFKICIYVLMK